MSESNSTPTCKLAFWKQRVFFSSLASSLSPPPFSPHPLLALGLAWEVGAYLESLERIITKKKTQPKTKGVRWLQRVSLLEKK